MRRKLPTAFVLIAFVLGTAWANSLRASDSQADAQAKLPAGYRGLPSAGYPIEAILAIASLERGLDATNLRIADLSKANGHLAVMGYSSPFVSWWPWCKPHGNPDGSIWLASRYIREVLPILRDRADALAEATVHSKHSLRDLDEALARAEEIVSIEASLQGQIYREERVLKEKYGKLASEIGAMPPWDLLKEKSIREAIKARR